jgi:DNA-binding NarL/FixJ family response regulator
VGEDLTPRQREILTLLANGHTMQETALELNISYSMVKDHCSNAYERLKLKRPRAITAIIQAIRTGQITLG